MHATLNALDSRDRPCAVCHQTVVATLWMCLQKTNSVEKALELLSGRDEVQGGAVCPKTNQEVSILTQTSLEELPLILLLHLKCFHYKLQACSKIIKTVEFPIDLKIEHSKL